MPSALLRVAVALLAGISVVLLLMPASGDLVSRCFGFLGYEVPCASWPSQVAGAITTVIVMGVIWLRR
jgi:hypothetical protein